MKIIKLKIYQANILQNTIFLNIIKLLNFQIFINLLEFSINNIVKFKSLIIKYVERLLILFAEKIEQNFKKKFFCEVKIIIL